MTIEYENEYGEWVPAEPLPYYYGMFPYIREKLKGNDGFEFIGWNEGIRNALFADWGDE